MEKEVKVELPVFVDNKPLAFKYRKKEESENLYKKLKHIKNKNKKHNYLLKNPIKPYVKERDGELESLPFDLKIPENIKDKFSQEEYKELSNTTFESCEVLYKKLREQIDLPKKVIEEVGKFEEMIPYLPEVNKFKRLVNMIVSDMHYLTNELNSIRKLYSSKYLDENGKVKDQVDYGDSYFLDFITDIKIRYIVVSNRIRSIILPSINHISDFYTSMKLRYYSVPENYDSAPDDIKKFFKERIKDYIYKEKNNIKSKSKKSKRKKKK